MKGRRFPFTMLVFIKISYSWVLGGGGLLSYLVYPPGDRRPEQDESRQG